MRTYVPHERDLHPSTDGTLQAIVGHVTALTPDSVPGDVLAEAHTRVRDALGCMCGGWDSPPARVAQAGAAREWSSRPASVLGTDLASTVGAAAFANSVATRYLDFNDTLMSGPSAGHPSDMIGGLLALAEAEHASGRDLLAAVVAAYEGFGVIAKEVSVRARGWDQGLLVALGTTVGATRLLRCDEEQTQHAVSLAVTMGVPPRSTRAGELSMWKGAATAYAVRSGILAAQLAADGMTGPPLPFEGKDGLWAQATGPFEVRGFGDPDPWMVSSSAIKFYPAEFNAQAPIELVVGLRDEVAASDVERLDVWTYWSSYDEIGNEPAKWAPETRETADHSLPYLLAVGLIEGEVTVDSFDPAHLSDSRIRDLMQRVSVHHDEGLTAGYPERLGNRLRVTTRDGGVREVSADFPQGHPARHPRPADIERKFRSLAVPALGAAGADAAWTALQALPSAKDVADLVLAFVPDREADNRG
jgi:2-methylcitrate dehydratase